MLRLTSFGFVRTPSRDFTDDGNYFTCYTYPGLEKFSISVCKDSKWGYYISASYEDGRLNYNEYSVIESYKELDCLNTGVTEDQAKENIHHLIEAMKNFHEEYLKKISELELISDEVIIDIYDNRYAQYMAFVIEVSKNVDSRILDLSEYELRNFKVYFENLKREMHRYTKENATKLSQSTRRQEVARKDKLVECYWYKSLKELLIKCRG